MIGLVIKSTGSWYDVWIEKTDEIFKARVVGKLRLEGLKLTNPIAVGDQVQLSKVNDDILINDVIPRTNYVVRQSPRKKHNLHIIASNIDQAILIVTITKPMLKQGFIDRFLLMTEPYNIPVIIVFNKSDLYKDKHLKKYDFFKEIYEKIGYACHLVSAENRDGLSELQGSLENKTSLFSGQSGVGKSTLLKAIMPNIEVKTTGLSDYTGKGQHSTTFAEMYFKNQQTRIIDSPGIKTLSFNHFEELDVMHNFKEIFAVSKHCKFANCQHLSEPDCAVIAALEASQISELRYLNYIQILEEVKDTNYWERNLEY